MEEITKSLIILLIGGFIGGFITAYINLRKQIFSEIWLKRFEHYKKLWAISGNLPNWPRENEITFAKLFHISNGLKNWYFNEGGILLSEEGRKKYEIVQILLAEKADIESKEKISRDDYDKIKDAFSDIRTQMTKDLSSRSSKLIN